MGCQCNVGCQLLLGLSVVIGVSVVIGFLQLDPNLAKSGKKSKKSKKKGLTIGFAMHAAIIVKVLAPCQLLSLLNLLLTEFAPDASTAPHAAEADTRY